MTRLAFIVLASIVLASTFACSDGVSGDPQSGFDAEAARFTDLICRYAVSCGPTPDAACKSDVETDLADAKAQLDEAGEARCAECLNAKSIELQKVFDDACNIRAADEDAIFAACDLDPAVDYDGDGTPDNDDDEACAGKP